MAVCQEQVKQQSVWFVMRFLYRHSSEMQDKLEKYHIPTFTPMCYKEVIRKGRKVRLRVPVIPSLLFVRAVRESLDPFVAADHHFQYQFKRGGKQNEALIVPDDQMEKFIRVSEPDKNPLYFAPQELNLTKGCKIRIISGPFEGITGTLLKVKGARKRRMVVSIPEILDIAVEVGASQIEQIKI